MFDKSHLRIEVLFAEVTRSGGACDRSAGFGDPALTGQPPWTCTSAKITRTVENEGLLSGAKMATIKSGTGQSH